MDSGDRDSPTIRWCMDQRRVPKGHELKAAGVVGRLSNPGLQEQLQMADRGRTSGTAVTRILSVRGM